MMVTGAPQEAVNAWVNVKRKITAAKKS